mgnify:CR=1 FL=1
MSNTWSCLWDEGLSKQPVDLEPELICYAHSGGLEPRIYDRTQTCASLSRRSIDAKMTPGFAEASGSPRCNCDNISSRVVLAFVRAFCLARSPSLAPGIFVNPPSAEMAPDPDMPGIWFPAPLSTVPLVPSRDLERDEERFLLVAFFDEDRLDDDDFFVDFRFDDDRWRETDVFLEGFLLLGLPPSLLSALSFVLFCRAIELYRSAESSLNSKSAVGDAASDRRLLPPFLEEDFLPRALDDLGLVPFDLLDLLSFFELDFLLLVDLLLDFDALLPFV